MRASEATGTVVTTAGLQTSATRRRTVGANVAVEAIEFSRAGNTQPVGTQPAGDDLVTASSAFGRDHD
jgi:hypothetical protein